MNHRLGLTLPLLFSLTAAACGPEPSLEVGFDEAPIAWGKLDAAHHEVGSLGGCSSTLIGRKTVLTAAHCVKSLTRIYKFSTRESVTLSASAVVHPGYIGDSNNDADLAILHLQEPVPGVQPATLISGALKETEPLVLVGFGLTDTNQLSGGKKYVGENHVDTLYSKTFQIINEKGAGICPGDSGGPSFVVRGGKEYICGVHSRGTFPPCGMLSGSGIDVRVDIFLDWIKKEAGADLYNGEFIDTTAPTVRISSPLAGVTAPRDLTVTATASDDVAVTRAELYLNGTRQEEITGPGPYTFQVKDLRPNDHEVRVVAHDAEKNHGEMKVAFEVKKGVAFGAACAVDAECESGRCVQGACTKVCTAHSDCPAGYGCGAAGLCEVLSEEGCSVEPAKEGGASRLLISLLLLGALLARRRRAG